MVERICPRCQHGNPLENRFCGACGSQLEHQALVPQQETGLTIAGVYLPVPATQLREVGKMVAREVTSLALEAGMAWLRNRVRQGNQPRAAIVQPTATAITQRAAPADATQRVVTIVSQRVVEVWEQGVLKRQTVERAFWQRDEQ